MNFGKINLITPPDTLFNNNPGYLLVKPSTKLKVQFQTILSAIDIDMVEFLIHLGANVNGADFKGEIAPLDIAFKTGNVEMQIYLQSKGAQRKKKHDTGGGGKDVNVYITDDVKKQIAMFVEKRNREEAVIKKHEEEQAAKEPKKKDAPAKKINWKDFLKLKNVPVVEKTEEKKVEVVKPVKQIVKKVEQVDVEVKSGRLQLDVEQEGYIFYALARKIFYVRP